MTGEKVPFYVSEESTGISGLSAFRDSHVAIGHVETVALRDVADIDRVDLLKIDTEGYEKFVLEGFPWERLRPSVVVAEFEDAKTKPLGYDTERPRQVPPRPRLPGLGQRMAPDRALRDPASVASSRQQ